MFEEGETGIASNRLSASNWHTSLDRDAPIRRQWSGAVLRDLEAQRRSCSSEDSIYEFYSSTGAKFFVAVLCYGLLQTFFQDTETGFATAEVGRSTGDSLHVIMNIGSKGL